MVVTEVGIATVGGTQETVQLVRLMGIVLQISLIGTAAARYAA